MLNKLQIVIQVLFYDFIKTKKMRESFKNPLNENVRSSAI